jgi:hypothetical protein
MINLTCSKCSFNFSEADKAWDDAIDNARCPKCLTSHPSWDLKNLANARKSEASAIETSPSWVITCLRILVSVVAWASSYLAIGISYRFASSTPISWTNIIFGYPWVALFIMNISWIANFRTHRFWPITGTILGLFATLFSVGSALYFAPLAICLAIWLVIYHLDIKIKDVLKRI